MPLLVLSCVDHGAAGVPLARQLARPQLHGRTTLAEPVHLPRKPNYDFEKRRKELDRKAKQEEKLRRKRENARDEEESPPALPDEGSAVTPE